jgi:hypothetical protein
MSIAYPLKEQWRIPAFAGIAVVALVVAVLIQTIMVQRQQYRSMEKKYIDDVARPQKLRLKLFLEETRNSAFHDDNNGVEDSDNGIVLLKSTPIADMFPHTTVIFAGT